MNVDQEPADGDGNDVVEVDGGEKDRVVCKRRNEMTEILHETFEGGGDGRGKSGDESDEGAHESEDLPVGFADVYVFGACAGEHRAEFREAESTA